MATITSASLSPRRTAAIANPACSPKSAASGASSSPGHSTPTGRNCIICAARARPAAPSRGAVARGAIDARRNPGRQGAQVVTRVRHFSRALFERFGRLRAQRLRATMAPSRRPVPAAVIIAMNGPSHDAAALCNSRRLSQSHPEDRRLVEGQGPGRRHRVQRAVRLARGRRQRAEGFRDHLRDARAHAVSARAVRGIAQAEAADHLGHAQRRDRYGGRQGAQGGAVRHAMGPRSRPRR